MCEIYDGRGERLDVKREKQTGESRGSPLSPRSSSSFHVLLLTSHFLPELVAVAKHCPKNIPGHLRVLLQTAHRVCVPTFSVRRVHSQPVTITDQFVPFLVANTEQHLKLVFTARKLQLSDHLLRSVDQNVVVRCDAR